MHRRSTVVFLVHLGTCGSVQGCHQSLQFQYLHHQQTKNTDISNRVGEIFFFKFNQHSVLYKKLAELSLSLCSLLWGPRAKSKTYFPADIPVLPHSLRFYPHGDTISLGISGHEVVVLKHFHKKIFLSLPTLSLNMWKFVKNKGLRHLWLYEKSISDLEVIASSTMKNIV